MPEPKAKLPLISHSMREAWRSCPRKVFYRYVAGIQPRERSQALIMGSAFHAGLEVTRKMYLDPPEVRGVVDPLLAGIAAAQTYATKAMVDDPAVSDEACAMSRIQLEAYLKGYDRAFQPRLGRVHVEMELRTADAIGYVDCAYVDDDKGVWFVDDKTTSAFDADQHMAVLMDGQLLAYGAMMRELGYKPRGALYRQTLKTRKGVTKGKSLEWYRDMLLDEYLQPDSGKYREFERPFDDNMLCWFEHMQDKVDIQIIDALDELQRTVWAWQYNSGSCIGKYGACDYLPLCSAMMRTREMRAPNTPDVPADIAALYEPNGKEAMDGGEFKREHGITGDRITAGGDDLGEWIARLPV